jgi:hypothetical protein
MEMKHHNKASPVTTPLSATNLWARISRKPIVRIAATICADSHNAERPRRNSSMSSPARDSLFGPARLRIPTMTAGLMF